MLHNLPPAAARRLGLVMPACLPHLSHVLQPQITCLNIDCALANVVLNVRISHFVLRLYVIQRKLISSLGCSQKRGCIMRDEASLPAFGQILARMPDDVFVWNERTIKLNDVARGASHSDWVPPGWINLDGWIGKITSEQQERVWTAANVSCSARASGAYQQNGPPRSPGTCGKRLVAIYHIAIVHSCCSGSECHLF